MKARAQVAAEVVESDDFMGLTLESQLCYYRLLLHEDLAGKVLGIRRVLRGYGADVDGTLEELLDAGLLVCVDGAYFDRFTWVNNTYNARIAERLVSYEELASSALDFEGEEFRSPYALP